MKKEGLKYILSIVLMLAIVFTIASSASAIRYLNVATSRVGGTWYPLGETFSIIVNKYVPDVQMNATTSSGPYENIRRLKNKTTDLAFILHNAAYQAYNGLEKFKGKEYKDLRILYNIPRAPLQILTMTKSGIKSIEQFKGKRIGDGSGGSSIPDGLDVLLEVYGMTRKDIKTVPMSRGDRFKALPDGNIDVGFYLINEGAAAMVELTSIHDVTFIPVPRDKLKAIEKIKPYWVPGVVDKKFYPKVLKTDYQCMVIPASVFVDKSMPADLVYSIMKAIWDHYEEAAAMNKMFSRIRKKDAILSTSGIPVHPGAERYFKEKGLLK